jgi:hypothetical protein
MRNLGKKGLSMSQAQSISNLCNQRAQEISNQISNFNVCSKSVTVDRQDYFLENPSPMPQDVGTLLLEKAALHATQGFLMEAIKAKEAELERIKSLRPNLEHIEVPVRKVPEDFKLLESITEADAWNMLSDAEYSEYLEAEAYASHLGQFIHRGGKLTNMRAQLSTLPAIEWMEIEVGKKTPVRIKAHHTSQELHETHEEIAEMHRLYEQRVNYFKAKVKNIVSETNARIQKENADKSAEYAAQEKLFNEEFKVAYDAYNAQVLVETMNFNSQRELDIKETAGLRIVVNPRFQNIIDQFLAKED